MLSRFVSRKVRFQSVRFSHAGHTPMNEVDPRFGEILGLAEEKVPEYVVSAFHVGRPLDLSKVSSLFPGSTTNSNHIKVVTNADQKKAFDIFKFGSVVFYNTPREEQRETTSKLLGLEVDASSAPYQMEGYDNYDTLLEVALDKEKADRFGLGHLPMESWYAVGALLARNSALQFNDAALDRVIDGIFTLNEDELREHVSYITNNVNSVNVFEDPKFETPSSNALYSSMKQDLKPDELYAEFHFKQAVLRNQYNITGAPQLLGKVA